MSQERYDKSSPQSILRRARRLLGKSLRELYPDIKETNAGKGNLGQCVERHLFEYEPNSNSKPDFERAGVELKCTPLKQIKDGSMVSKERLVLNIINYLEEGDAGNRFETSSFSRKNALLLLMFYLHLAGVDNLDLVFKIIRLWKIPREDLKIFRDDWKIIHDKIANGRAHELSEGDTLYLAACIKGSKGGANKRPQPGTSVLADQRAYSIKSSYLNFIIAESMTHSAMCDDVRITDEQLSKIAKKKEAAGNAVRSESEYKDGETFEQLISRRFRPYLGLSVTAIARKLKTSVSQSPKAVSYSLCRAILGVKTNEIAEFKKAGVLIKTIRLEESGTLKEAMSFQSIKYNEIPGEKTWESSDWYNTVVRRFFFVVFRKKRGGTPQDAVLEDIFFWAMPRKDVDKCKRYWKDIRTKVIDGDYDRFLKSSEHPICHVRPKAKNAADLTDTPQGGKAKKYCYWLNREYVLNIVNSHLQSH